MSVVTENQLIYNFLPQASQANETTKVDSKTQLGKDAFLKLLVTQMRHQDPLNPLEGIEFTQQLAQFTSLEQLISLNASFSGVNQALTAQNNFQAINLVGKDIKAQSDAITVNGSTPSKGLFNLEDTAAVKVQIYDETGALVRVLELGARTGGENSFDWDGRNGSGALVPDGAYTFRVLATDAEGAEVKAVTQIKGRVTGVAFDSAGQPTLMVGGLKVGLSQVIEIVAPE